MIPLLLRSAQCRSGLRLLIALVLLIATSPASAIVLAWDPNDEPDVAGYRVYYGTASGDYSEVVDVGNATSTPIEGLLPGATYFFVVTAYNSTLLESLPSEEIAYSVPGLAPVIKKGGFRGGGELAGSLAHLRMAVNKKGRFSGKLFVHGSTAIVRGKFDASGQQTVQVITRSGLEVSVHLQADSTGAIAATITVQGEAITLALSSRGQPATEPSQHVGKYTLVLGTAVALDPTSQAPVPDFSGSAIVTISNSGVVRMVGKLADGLNFTLVSLVGPNGEIPVGGALYDAPRGLLSGNLFLRETADVSDGDGTFGWMKPASSTGIYPDGFIVRMPAILSRFLPPQGPFNPTVNAGLSGGELPAELDPIEKSVPLPGAGAGTAIPLAADRLELTIARGNGLVRGTFIHPLDGKPRNLHGVWFQKQSAAFGSFKGVATSGTFTLTALPSAAAP
jgi:hypothetical protein